MGEETSDFAGIVGVFAVILTAIISCLEVVAVMRLTACFVRFPATPLASRRISRKSR
jgi:hypothetical protein